MKNVLQLIAMLFFCAFLSACNKYLGDPTNSFNYDADVQKFIDSSGISDLTQKSAVNTLVKQLKDSSLWTKFIAIYPMVGGTAATTKWNLKNIRNSDEAYRLTFSGAPAYSATGVLFQTTSDYADTHIKDSVLTYNDNSISYYSETQNTINGYDMGCYDFGFPYNELTIYNKGDASNWYGFHDFGPTPANTKGLFMLSATVSDVTRYENGVASKSSGVAPVLGATGFPILIGKVSGAIAGGNRECALATIGSGLTDAQALTLYRIVQNFETLLGR